MSDKKIVKLFIDFLETNPECNIEGFDVCNNKELRIAILKTIELANQDGIRYGEASELFDKTLISNKNDW
jgi:hypothetical protein